MCTEMVSKSQTPKNFVADAQLVALCLLGRCRARRLGGLQPSHFCAVVVWHKEVARIQEDGGQGQHEFEFRAWIQLMVRSENGGQEGTGLALARIKMTSSLRSLGCCRRDANTAIRDCNSMDFNYRRIALQLRTGISKTSRLVIVRAVLQGLPHYPSAQRRHQAGRQGSAG
jgi:hypothetical protein